MKNLKILTLLFSVGAVLSTGCSNKNDENILKIGLECNYAPFNWSEAKANDFTLPIYNDSGKFADGYDIQMAKRISKSLNREVRIYKLEWDGLIINLNNKVIDAVIAGMTDTEERRQSISFTDEYYRSELVLIAKKTASDPVEGKTLGKDDLSSMIGGKIIESQRSTVTDDVIDTFEKDYGSIHATAVDSFAKAALDVESGAAFAMTAELPVAQSITAQYPDLGIIHIDQEILGVDLSSLGVSIGIRKNDDTLKEELNGVLKEYTTDERNADMIAAVSRSGE